MAPAGIKHTEHPDNNNNKENMQSLRRALVNRNYAKLWSGQAVSAVGDAVFGTTLVLWVSQVLVRGSAWGSAAGRGVLVGAGGAGWAGGPRPPPRSAGSWSRRAPRLAWSGRSPGSSWTGGTGS